MNKLMEKIQKHPRSNVARAYKLGIGHSDGLTPILKLAIRLLVVQSMSPTFDKKVYREKHRLQEKLLELTKQP